MTLKVEKLSKWRSLVLLLLLSSLCADNTILDGRSVDEIQKKGQLAGRLGSSETNTGQEAQTSPLRCSEEWRADIVWTGTDHP